MPVTVNYPALKTLAIYKGRKGETVRTSMLPLAAIQMPGFQRDRIQRHIDKLAGDFDATAFCFPIIALFFDTLLCIDGQQRIAAAEQLGHEKVACLLVEGIETKDRLADLFLKVNRDRRLLDALQKYVAALESKDRGAIEIKKILDTYELVGAKSSSVTGKVPIGAVHKIYDQGGGEQLERVLSFRFLAWGDKPSKEANEGQTLLGLSTFVRRHWDKIDDDRLVDVLRRHHPGYLLSEVDRGRTNFAGAYADNLRTLYNRTVRGKGRL